MEGSTEWPKGGVLARYRCVSDVICGCHGDAIDWPTRRQTSRESRRRSDYCLPPYTPSTRSGRPPPPTPAPPGSWLLFHPDSPCFAERGGRALALLAAHPRLPIPRAFTSPLTCHTSEPCSARSTAHKRIQTHENPLLSLSLSVRLHTTDDRGSCPLWLVHVAC